LLNFIKLIAQILLYISYVHVIFWYVLFIDKCITIRSAGRELIVLEIKLKLVLLALNKVNIVN